MGDRQCPQSLVTSGLGLGYWHVLSGVTIRVGYCGCKGAATALRMCLVSSSTCPLHCNPRSTWRDGTLGSDFLANTSEPKITHEVRLVPAG